MRPVIRCALAAATPLTMLAGADPAAADERQDRRLPGHIGVATPHVVHPASPRKVVILLHGGSWLLSGPVFIASTDAWARVWERRDWTTVQSTYRPGLRSIDDSLEVYDRVRERVGPYATVCVYGFSAGGHLALTVAARRRSVDCAISEAGPTDLAHYRTYRGPGGAADLYGNVIRPIFGGRLQRSSPIAGLERLRARVAQLAHVGDQLVPVDQALRYQAAAQRTASARHRVRTVTVTTGSGARVGHAETTRSQSNAARRLAIDTARSAALERRDRSRSARDRPRHVEEPGLRGHRGHRPARSHAGEGRSATSSPGP